MKCFILLSLVALCYSYPYTSGYDSGYGIGYGSGYGSGYNSGYGYNNIYGKSYPYYYGYQPYETFLAKIFNQYQGDISPYLYQQFSSDVNFPEMYLGQTGYVNNPLYSLYGGALSRILYGGSYTPYGQYPYYSSGGLYGGYNQNYNRYNVPLVA